MHPNTITLTSFTLAAMLFGVLPAKASISLTFFPGSDFNANSAMMDATLGTTGFQIDTFESTTLLSGLTISLSGGVTSTTWSALPALFDGDTFSSFTQSQFWDGTHEASNATGNLPNSITTPSNIANLITFNYAAGALSFGIGLSNFQSLTTSGGFAVTNHDLFVNGVNMGVLETLAGNAWSPGLTRNAYVRIDATGGSTITSVGFENINQPPSEPDFLMFDHLAIQPEVSTVPEPSYEWPLILGGLMLVLLRRYRRV